MVNNVLSSIYYDTSKPGSYGGVESLFKEAVKVDSTLTRKKSQRLARWTTCVHIK